MGRKDSEKELIPSARRLIRSLRDVGYDFSAAIADLIDNSIEAGATLVTIDIEFDGDKSWVCIADNGKGMTAGELKEAMRYGSDREYTEADLGKFGLGLKTSSLSQCQRLTVASRTNSSGAGSQAFCWDLDHVEKTNRWTLLPIKVSDLDPSTRRRLRKGTGTIVLWQRLDRILGYNHPYGEFARKRLLSMCRDAEEHLGMVFHRFLSGQVANKQVTILINGNQIEPWDPFAPTEQKTKKLKQATIKVEHEGVIGKVTLQPYVLPHQDDFSSPAAFKNASGPSNWNQQQGFYVYRSGRMIQSGGWCRLRTADEHTKLARVALSFSPKLDEAFKINVAKMRVQLPASARDQIAELLKPVIKLAQDTYRRRKPPSRAMVNDLKGQSERVSSIPDSNSGKVRTAEQSYGQEERRWTWNEFCAELKNASETGEWDVVKRVLNRLRAIIGKEILDDIR
jgi:hypothetical protein